MLATSPNLEDGNDIRYYYQRQEQEGHQITCPLDREKLERNKVSTTTLIDVNTATATRTSKE